MSKECKYQRNQKKQMCKIHFIVITTGKFQELPIGNLLVPTITANILAFSYENSKFESLCDSAVISRIVMLHSNVNIFQNGASCTSFHLIDLSICPFISLHLPSMCILVQCVQNTNVCACISIYIYIYIYL